MQHCSAPASLVGNVCDAQRRSQGGGARKRTKQSAFTPCWSMQNFNFLLMLVCALFRPIPLLVLVQSCLHSSFLSPIAPGC